MDDPPPEREQHGFRRTRCACAFCTAPCRHIPGSLDVGDLERLCPPGRDIFDWAEEHLRAVPDKAFPTLVPARQVNGHCHWLYDGRCVVHAHAPFSCAFFDAHQSDDEVQRRSTATIEARRQDAMTNGLYARIWRHLRDKGFVSPSGDRVGLAQEVRTLQRQAEGALRRE